MSRDSEGASKAPEDIPQDLEGVIAKPPSESDINDLQGPKEKQRPVVIEEELE
jgi:hypothetical protein